MDISPKVNLIACQGFELTYYNVAVQHINYYSTDFSSDEDRFPDKFFLK